MKTILTTAAIALPMLLPACDPGEADPMTEEVTEQSEAEDYRRILEAEHLAEFSFDEGDFATHMSLWAPGRFEFVSPFASFEEADEYEAWVTGFYDYTQKLGGTRHFVINPVVTLDEDTAEFEGYLHVINRADGSFMGSSVIRDRLVRTDEGWRFSYRSVEPDQDLSES